jgi:TRL-like protein family
MHRTLVLMAVLGSFALSACAVVMSPVGNGSLFTDVRGPLLLENGVAAEKVGRACAHNVLGLAAYGDASMVAAKRQGAIDRIATVDHHSVSVLSVYSRFCTQVRGE